MAAANLGLLKYGERDTLMISESFILFQGAWKFHRSIDDQRENTPLRASGTATWRQIDSKPTNVLRYDEHGRLEVGNHHYDFSRQYYYFFYPDLLEIFFADGINAEKIFLSFVLAESTAVEAEHICNQDKYRAHLVLPRKSNPKFSLSFEVEGPQKKYRIITKYKKSN